MLPVFPTYRTEYKIDRYKLKFIQQHLDVQVWDVSVKSPVRRFLGQIEYSQSKSAFVVLTVDRKPAPVAATFSTYEEAASHLFEWVFGFYC